MTTIVSFIIVLGILIFIHELGHFLVAKYTGVGVEKFSLGFGPKIVGIKRGETEYRISLLPLGGYVKMVGESPDEEVPREEMERSFTHKPLVARTAIVASGPIMNIVLAVILFPVIFMMGITVPSFLDGPAEIGFVAPDGAGAKAGLKRGDIVRSIDGESIKTWEELESYIALNPDRELLLEVQRGDRTFQATLRPRSSETTGAGIAGIYPPMKPVIGAVTEGYPAAEAGLRPGDLIRAVDGKEITYWAELEELIHRSPGEKTFVIERDGETFTVRIKPMFNSDAGVYLVGISPHMDFKVKSFGFFESVKLGVVKAVELTALLFVVVKKLVLGEVSIKTLGGPIMIAQVAGQAAESGLTDLLSLMAFLSLQLGIINLFPIPVLDGGHLLFFAIEFVRGRPLSERVMGVAQQVGIALLIALMVLVTWNDIFRILG